MFSWSLYISHSTLHALQCTFSSQRQNSDGSSDCFQHHQRPVPHVHPAVSGLSFKCPGRQGPTGTFNIDENQLVK